MSTIYITGHRNPDLDSICSAYAYANLKNIIDPENHHVAIRCGHLSENVKKIVEALEITPPPYIRDVYPKVEDVMLTSPHKFEADSPLTEIAKSYENGNPSAMPIFHGDEFCGLLSVDDITAWAMRALSEKGNLGNVPLIRDVMIDQAEPVHVHELYEEAKSRLSASKKRGLAVYDENGYVGYITRRCFLKAPKYNVIMVDHNEQRQSIRGIETANVVEIIDHHRIDAGKTELPIFIDTEPLGSTCTIVFQLYQRHNLTPDPETAKVLLAGMISDTLILKSPTTTYVDQISAKALADICGVDVEEFGMFLFSHTVGLCTRDPHEAISSDFKMYNEKGVNVGIGQCEVTSLQDLDEYSATYLEELEKVREENGLQWAVLMVTDIIRESSILLCTNYKMNKHLQYKEIGKMIYDMPGVMSRKKQLLPELLSVIDMYL